MKKTVEESDPEKGDPSETELENSTKKETCNTKEKSIFVYQSSEMKYLYQKYAPHLILLDAAYKTLPKNVCPPFIFCRG